MSVKTSLRILSIWALAVFWGAGSVAVAQTKPVSQKQYEQLIYSVKGPDLYACSLRCLPRPRRQRQRPGRRDVENQARGLDRSGKKQRRDIPRAASPKIHFRRRALPDSAWLPRDARLGPDLSPDRGRPGPRQRPFAKPGQIFADHSGEVARFRFRSFPYANSGCCSSGARVFLAPSFSIQYWNAA